MFPSSLGGTRAGTWPPAPLAEVVDHSGPVFECPPGVSPHVGPLGLARTGVEQADRRLVRVKHARAEHEGPVRVVQGQQLCPGLTAPGRQRRARRVHARAGVDLLLAVVRKMIDKPTDHGVGLQGRRWQRVVKDLGRGALLHHQLAAPTGPFAPNLTLHEELRRHNVQPLADVFSHAHHGLAAFWRWAVRVLGLHPAVYPRQVCRQCFALGLVAWLPVWCTIQQLLFCNFSKFGFGCLLLSVLRALWSGRFLRSSTPHLVRPARRSPSAGNCWCWGIKWPRGFAA